VKRARELRRCAQVLLDCRWYAKKFVTQRRELHRSWCTSSRHTSSAVAGEISVICTLASHLKLQVASVFSRFTAFVAVHFAWYGNQVACDTPQPMLELEMSPDATAGDLKKLAAANFRIA